MQGIIQGRVPPNSKDAEEAVLGAIMLERNKLEDVLEIINDCEMFYYPEHQIVFSSIQNLYESGSSVDMISISEWLNKKGKLEEIGGPYTIARLTNSVVSSANILTHSVIIKEKWIRRKQIEISGELLKSAYDEDKSVFETSDEIGNKIDELSMQGVSSDLVPINTQLASTLKELEDQRNGSEEMTGISSGYHKLDILTDGWQKSDLIILAARPSVGKTAFALNLAVNASNKVNVIVFSLEMSNNQLAKRLISISEKISMSELNRPKKMGSIVWDKVARSVNLSNKKIYLNDITDISPLQIKAKTKALMKKLKRLNGHEEEFLIIVDYLQLADSGNKDKKGNREQFISEISRGLKKTAKELEVPVIALSQLSRSVSDDEQPTLSSLRESGAIEQDADVVMFLYRPSQSEKNEVPELEYANYLDIAKNRNGAIESKIVFFNDMSIQTFSDSKMFNDASGSVPNKSVIRPNYDIDDNQLIIDNPF